MDMFGIGAVFNMNEEFLAAIRSMLKTGRHVDLLKLMDGESEYSSKSTRNIPKTRDEIYEFRMAVEHVRFVARFGLTVSRAIEGDKTYSAYPHEFDSWVRNGAKGIEEDELLAYLDKNPL
jgi:hypothetical protein